MQRNKLILIVLLFFIAGGAFIIFPKEKIFKLKPTTVQLYYYDQNKDLDEARNIKCSKDGLVEVKREISQSDNLIEDTIDLLISGDLKPDEVEDGITTEFPLDGFFLANSYLENGVLTLEFIDSQNQTVGGACRVGILWAQIEETARQFEEVEEVRFIPEEIFQP